MTLLGPKLDCDFIFYDYEGYGFSGGEMHSRNLKRDLRAVYNYARQFYSGSSIFFVGESSTFKLCLLFLVGSVPSCYLAAELSAEYEALKAKGDKPPIPLAGIIMQAAVYAGMNRITL